MKIVYKIKKVRELRNYTQEFMADQLGISQVAYSKVETGQTRLDINRLQQIAGILDVDPMTLMNFDESFIFNNCHQYQGGKVINNYHTLAETERNTLLKRIEELEKELIKVNNSRIQND